MIEDTDWKKYAAQTYSDQDVEKAFLDQAYMFVQNKASPLMKPPHRLGFEIVFKNDANSRMVGIFAFRVGDELIYAPAFFINGSIKGTDLLYRHKNKAFVPMTNEWATYLIGLQENKMGSGISKEDSQISSGGGIEMDKITHPPAYSGSKSASYKSFCELNDFLPSGKEVLEDMDAELEKEAGESILKKFIVEDGGFSSVDLITRSVEKNAAFANAMVKHVGVDNFLPKELQDNYKSEILEKSASTIDRSVTLHIGMLNEKVASIDESLTKKGYKIEDNRDSSSIIDKVYHAEHDGEFSGPKGPGIYQVMDKDGTYRRCLVAPGNSCDLASSRVEWDTDCEFRPMYGDNSPEYCVVDLNSNSYGKFKSDDIVAVNSEDDDAVFADEDISKSFSDTPSSGKHYMMLDVSGKSPHDKTLSRKFYVNKKLDSANGVDKYEIDWRYSPSEESYGEAYVLTLNPDYDGVDYNDRTFQKGSVVFVEVSSDNGNMSLANNDDLYKFITQGTKIKKASIHALPMDYYVVKTASYTSPELSKMSLICSLISNEGFSEKLADSVIEKAAAKGTVALYYPALEKKAHNLSFGMEPEFYQDVDEDFNISRESPQSVSIISDSDDPGMPESRIGDTIKFEDGAEVGERGPMELAQLAEQMSSPSLFEHGVVGSLAKTYDSSLLIEKYFPDLEKALDKMGRMIFLFYWKPEDFSDLYGSDDQSSLENLLLSNFKSFGELVLELLKKTQSYSESVGRSY